MISYLDIEKNNLFQDLSFLKKLVNLEKLKLSDNPIYGSLEPLKNLTKLEHLGIINTDLNSGVEYLPDSLSGYHHGSEKIWHSTKEYP